jgi:hypothetical protein
MPRGGARPGAGRPKGSKDKDAAGKPKVDLAKILAGTYHAADPASFLEEVMRDPNVPLLLRIEAAKQAAPFRNAKLAPKPASNGDDQHQQPTDGGWAADLRPN